MNNDDFIEELQKKLAPFMKEAVEKAREQPDAHAARAFFVVDSGCSNWMFATTSHEDPPMTRQECAMRLFYTALTSLLEDSSQLDDPATKTGLAKYGLTLLISTLGSMGVDAHEEIRKSVVQEASESEALAQVMMAYRDEGEVRH